MMPPAPRRITPPTADRCRRRSALTAQVCRADYFAFQQRRFHPILKRTMPHLGVDYAAPAGTPVQAIGEGRVVFAGCKGGDGNMVEIQHANGYQTMYLHLSAILVREGQHVEAGGRIGLVGSTGLATGPHLDFRILDHGVFRNFETLRNDLRAPNRCPRPTWPNSRWHAIT